MANRLKEGLDRLPLNIQVRIVEEAHEFLLKRLAFYQNIEAIKNYARNHKTTN